MWIGVDWTRHVLLPTGFSTLLAIVAPAGACVGDCDQTCTVDVREVLIGINQVLGNHELGACEPMDADRDGSVLANEVIMAVRNALDRCPDAPPEIVEPGGGTQVPAGTVPMRITVPPGTSPRVELDGTDVTDLLTIVGGVATGSLRDVPPGVHDLIVSAYCAGSAYGQFEAVAP